MKYFNKYKSIKFKKPLKSSTQSEAAYTTASYLRPPEPCPKGNDRCGFLKKRYEIEMECPPHKKIFIMIEFGNNSNIKKLIRAIKRSALTHKLKAILAEDKEYCTDLYCNICLHMKTCKYGIAVFYKGSEDKYNANVAYELGFMEAEGKSCLLLLEKKLERLHTDLIGRIRKKFTFNNVAGYKKDIKKWIESLSS